MFTHAATLIRSPPIISFFFEDFIYLFLERGEGREKARERNINVLNQLTLTQHSDQD